MINLVRYLMLGLFTLVFVGILHMILRDIYFELIKIGIVDASIQVAIGLVFVSVIIAIGYVINKALESAIK